MSRGTLTALKREFCTGAPRRIVKDADGAQADDPAVLGSTLPTACRIASSAVGAGTVEARGAEDPAFLPRFGIFRDGVCSGMRDEAAAAAAAAWKCAKLSLAGCGERGDFLAEAEEEEVGAVDEPAGTLRGLEWTWSGEDGGLTDSIFLGEDMDGVRGDFPSGSGPVKRAEGAPKVCTLWLLGTELFCNVLLPWGVGRAAVNWPVPALLPCRCISACWKARVAPFCTGNAVGCASSKANGLGVRAAGSFAGDAVTADGASSRPVEPLSFSFAEGSSTAGGAPLRLKKYDGELAPPPSPPPGAGSAYDSLACDAAGVRGLK